MIIKLYYCQQRHERTHADFNWQLNLLARQSKSKITLINGLRSNYFDLAKKKGGRGRRKDQLIFMNCLGFSE